MRHVADAGGVAAPHLADRHAGERAPAGEHRPEDAPGPVVEQAVELAVPSGRAELAQLLLQHRLSAAPGAGECQPGRCGQDLAHLLGAGLRRRGEPDQPVVEELGVAQVARVGALRHLDDGQADPVRIEVDAEGAARDHSDRLKPLGLGGQVGRVEGDVQALVVEPKGEIDRLLGREAGRLPQELARFAAHGGQLQHDGPAVDGQRAGRRIRREAEVAVAALGLVAARAERAQAALAPCLAADQALATAFQLRPSAEDEASVRPRLAQVHALQRGAVQEPRVGDPEVGEARLDEIAQLVLPQDRPVRLARVGVGGAHGGRVDAAQVADRDAFRVRAAVGDGDRLQDRSVFALRSPVKLAPIPEHPSAKFHTEIRIALPSGDVPARVETARRRRRGRDRIRRQWTYAPRAGPEDRTDGHGPLGLETGPTWFGGAAARPPSSAHPQAATRNAEDRVRE